MLRDPHYQAAPFQEEACNPSTTALEWGQAPAGSPSMGAEQHTPLWSNPAPALRQAGARKGAG